MSSKKEQGKKLIVPGLMLGCTLVLSLALFIGLPSQKASLQDEDGPKASSRTPVRTSFSKSELPSENRPAVGAELQVLPHPLAYLIASEEEQRRLYEAEEKAVETCMQHRGFVYKKSDYKAEGDPEALRHDPADIGRAQANGYGVADAFEKGETPLSPDPNEEILKNLSSEQQAQWQAALSGPPQPHYNPRQPTSDPNLATVELPSGGIVMWNRKSCLSEAKREIFGDELQARQLEVQEEELRNDIVERTQADPEFQAGIERWRVCMRGKGFAYERPQDAADRLSEEFQKGQMDIKELRRREIAAATADAGCYRDVGLLQVRFEVQNRVEQQVRVDEGSTLSALESMHRSANQKAFKLSAR